MNHIISENKFKFYLRRLLLNKQLLRNINDFTSF